MSRSIYDKGRDLPIVEIMKAWIEDIVEKKVQSALEELRKEDKDHIPEVEGPLNIDKLCEVLGYSKSYIYRQRLIGNIKGHKKGNRLFFYLSESK